MIGFVKRSKSLKIGIMQPYFMPYIGYWQRINAVDIHVLYDDVQYIKGGWINRNRIILHGEIHNVNVPLLGASPNKLINEVGVDNREFLQSKLLKTLYQAYSKANYFNEAMTILESIIRSRDLNLAEYLEFQIREICKYLGIDTKIQVSSSLKKDNSLKGQDKVIAICKLLNATEYINASSGEHLYSKESFLKENITLRFIKDKGSITYAQLSKTFIPSLSIIDVMMNCSKEEIKTLLEDYILY